jgi:hypothetical protein
MHRLQTLFAYLFHRIVYYPPGTLGTILSVVRPASIRPSASEQTDAQQLLDQLFGAISKTHMRLTTHFLEYTEYGREYWRKLSVSRKSKVKSPLLEHADITESLDLPANALRMIWHPLTMTVPSELWTEKECADGEQWAKRGDSDSATIARFRELSAEVVGRMVKLWSKSQAELSTHTQFGIFKELSARMLASEWPPFHVSAKLSSTFRPGVYIPEKIHDFLDLGFQTRALQFQHKADEESASDNGEDDDSQQKGDIDMDAEEENIDKDSDDDIIDETIDRQITDALLDTEVLGRPMIFGSEFEETGGTGLGRKSMTEIMDIDEGSRDQVVAVLEETGDSILGHPYSAEEAEAIAAMGARAIAKYAKLRLERENYAINDAIWRMQQIVNDNQSEIEDLDARIAQEIEKRQFFEQLTTQMTSSYTSIDDKSENLQKMTGAVVEDDQTPPKVSWKDRVKIAQQKAQQGVGMHWKYTPKPGAGKGKEPERTPSRFQTPLSFKSAIPSRPVTPDTARPAEPIPSSSFSITAETKEEPEVPSPGDDLDL